MSRDADAAAGWRTAPSPGRVRRPQSAARAGECRGHGQPLGARYEEQVLLSRHWLQYAQLDRVRHGSLLRSVAEPNWLRALSQFSWSGTARLPWASVGADGRLDVFVANYVDFAEGKPPFVADEELRSRLDASPCLKRQRKQDLHEPDENGAQDGDDRGGRDPRTGEDGCHCGAEDDEAQMEDPTRRGQLAQRVPTWTRAVATCGTFGVDTERNASSTTSSAVNPRAAASGRIRMRWASAAPAISLTSSAVAKSRPA